MESVKLKFGLLTALAFALMLVAGVVLKTNPELTRPQMIGWGLVLTAGALTFVRGLRLLFRR